MSKTLGKIGTILDWLGDDAGDLVLAFAEKTLLEEAKKREFSDIPKWEDRTTGREVTPIDFIKANYGILKEDGTWDANGLTTKDIWENDTTLYNSYIQRIRRKPKEALDLPKESYITTGSAEDILEGRRKKDRDRKFDKR